VKAALIKEVNQYPVIEEISRPEPGPGEVLIQLKAAALNHRDVWIRKGRYPGMQFPILPGSDGAGVVVAAGSPELEKWLGRPVVINPSLNWGEAKTHYGPDFRILGLEDHGTFAEYIRIPAEYVFDSPAHLTFEQAAALPLAGLTAWRCLMSRAKLSPGDKVLITGAGGGVALFALQFAVKSGAEVWVTSGSEEKIRRAVEMGARGGLNYRNPDWHKEFLKEVNATGVGYFDVIIDSAAGPDFKKLTDVATPGGRICIYGGTVGPITDLIPARIFFKQLNIMGSTMGTPEEFADMLQFVQEHRMEPVIDSVRPFHELVSGMERMEKGEQFGKLVFTF